MIVVPLNWIGLVDLILTYIHLTDFLVEEKFSWLPSKIKRLWKQFEFSEPHKFSRQITRFNLFLILSFFYNIRTEFRTQHAEEDDPERLQQIIERSIKDAEWVVKTRRKKWRKKNHVCSTSVLKIPSVENLQDIYQTVTNLDVFSA